MDTEAMARRRIIAYSTATAVLLALTGCAAGPDFQKPAAPQVQGYTAAPPPAMPGVNDTPAGGAQVFKQGQDIPAAWWTLFHSEPLDELITRALKDNPDLKAAQAALASARETALAQEGGYYPSVSADYGVSRQKTSSQLQPTPNSGDLYFSLYTPQVSVSYVPDVFGLNRRSVEFLNAQAEQARYALIATDIALSANVAAAAIQEAALRAQVDATRELVKADQDMLQVLQKQYAKGYASRLDVAAQESQLAQAAATLPPLEKQLAAERDQLAALCGAFPGEAGIPDFDLASLELPAELPLTLPSQLVEQRPDVRQAEENLHAASAEIGIAAANRLPNFTLSADAGAVALAANQIFRAGTGVWALAGDISQPLFQGGALEHKEQAARDAYTQAAEQYRSTVLTAFQNVADSLNALEQDAAALKAAAQAADAAKVTLALAQQQYQAGYSGSLALLSAEQAYQQASVNLVQAEANRYADTAALFEALGGGWWNDKDLAKD